MLVSRSLAKVVANHVLAWLSMHKRQKLEQIALAKLTGSVAVIEKDVGLVSRREVLKH